MTRMIDQIRASKLPSNLMQFAARGALSVSPEENLEILVYLAEHNRVFGDQARMTLAGWDEQASLAAAADPKAPREVLRYMIAPENLRPKLLPALLENPGVSPGELARFALSASPESIAAMLKSSRVRASRAVLESLRSNPHVVANQAATVNQMLQDLTSSPPLPAPQAEAAVAPGAATPHAIPGQAANASGPLEEEVPEEDVNAYLAEHAEEIKAEEGKPFQPVGGILELLGADYFPVSAVQSSLSGAGPSAATAVSPGTARPPGPPVSGTPLKRENTMQKINSLDVKGRIQLALKGNKEERSILIRDGTKVVALAVLDAPKLSDGEVEKFALQKNVLEAVLRQIPLKRRFMKNYLVVRNLVSNPRTPLDLSLGLMKHLLPQDLKNLSGNKEISETVRKLALKQYRQKLDAANKK
jgi:hypothetical protein